MKKEYLFFLIFVLAAAIVTGATIGLISNFHYIEQQTMENTSQIEPAQQQASTPNPSEQGDSINNTDNKGDNVPVAHNTSPIAEQGYVVLSGEEKQQVIDMLVSLGATKDGDYSNFIRNFQKEKSLNPTGSLDSLTLNAIINEVTRQRAAQMAGG